MLLYIEDNPAIAENVIAYLQAESFAVTWIADGEEGLQAALDGYYDCIVLDVMLPGKNGFEICHAVRKHKQVPIIMTTARGALDDKGEGFDQGADDYLVKPFELAELVMRIRSLMKRSQVSDTITFGDVEILSDENRCLKQGIDVKLTLKEWQILLELVDAQGITVTRADIIDTIWGQDALFASDGKLDVYIANLRKKLGKKLIETVKGVGYRIRK